MLANIQARTGRFADQTQAELVKRNSPGRLLRSDEVAGAVMWLH